MRPPSSPPKVTVQALEDSDDEGETAGSTLPEGSPSRPQGPQELIQAHFDNISTASDTQVRATGRSCQQGRGEPNAARADTNANTEPAREEGAGDYTCTCSTKRIVPEHHDPEEHDNSEEHDNPEENGDPEPATPEGALVRSKGKEVVRQWPASKISQCLPSPHALAAGKMIDPNPNPGVRPDFINPYARRPSALANYRHRAELRKAKEAAAAAASSAGEGSKSTNSPRGREEKPKDEAETASSASVSRNPDSGNPQHPVLGGPPSGPSVHFNDNAQSHEGMGGARRRIKGRWQKIKNWVKREWGVRKRKG
jgi:hypothetical protein